MRDEYRLTVRFQGTVDPDVLEAELAERLPNSADRTWRDGVVYVYPDDQREADKAADLLPGLLEEHGAMQVDTELAEWDNEAGRWITCRSETAAAIFDEVGEDEPDAAVEEGIDVAFEVEVRLPPSTDAREIGDALESDGVPILRRGRRRLVLGGADAEDARRVTEAALLLAPGATVSTRRATGVGAWLRRNGYTLVWLAVVAVAVAVDYFWHDLPLGP